MHQKTLARLMLRKRTSTSGPETTGLGASGLSQISDFLGSWHQSQNVKINIFDAESGTLVLWLCRD